MKVTLLTIFLFFVYSADIVSGFVKCGNHNANSCSECPNGNGADWCNGHCKWENGACVLGIRCRGGDSCCTEYNQCGDGEGDCDSDDDCRDDLICLKAGGGCYISDNLDDYDDCC